MKFGILTSAALPNLNSSDRSLRDILEQHQHSCEPLIWDQLETKKFLSSNQEKIDVFIIRSTWDYYLNVKFFLHVIDRLPAPLINSAEIIRWNSNKNYLLNLQQSGIAIVPTKIIHKKSQLDGLSLPWDRIIAKPTVSANSYLTHLLDQNEFQNALPKFESILSHSELMLQPFIPEILDVGEVSMVYFNIDKKPQYSHAVLKTAKSGEFRIQNDFGGSVEAYQPCAEEKYFGETVLLQVKSDWVYARVDMIRSRNGLLLCELEMIEPELFMSFAAESAVLFYQAIQEYLKRLKRH